MALVRCLRERRRYRDVSLPIPLITGAWPNHSDHAHLRWIDEHDPIVHLGELIGLGFRVGGEDVVRQRVKIDDRRHVRPDVSGDPTGCFA